ncbi:MAG TPA: hypothetical protein VKE40_23825, partial [Gemmataceae bacterium]|nr:hypothetical protein [Gemmataceae bacterium]
LPLEADHLYQVTVEYQLRGTTNGQLKVNDTDVRGRAVRDLKTTARGWATATATFRPGISVNPGRLEFAHTGSDVMAIRRIEVADQGPAPPPGQIAYRSDFGALAPAKIKLQGKEMLESTGQIPAGFQTYAWDGNSIMEFAVEPEGNTRVLALRSLEGRESGMIFLPDVTVRKGVNYWVSVEYQCYSDRAGKVRALADPGKVRDISELPGTTGEWRTIHIPFRLQDDEGEAVRFEFHITAKGAENPLRIRSVVVAEAGLPTAPAGLGQSLYRFTAADAKPFRTTLSQGRHVTRTEVSDMPAGFMAGVWKKEDTGEVAIEDIAGRRAVTLKNEDGSVSIQFFATQPIAQLSAGREYTLRVVHWGNADATGKIEVRKPRVNTGICAHRVRGTNGQWEETTSKFTPTEDGPVHLYFQNSAGGDSGKVAFHTVELIGPGGTPVGAAGGSSYQLSLAGTRAFARRYKKDAVVETQGDGNLPAPWAANTAGDETLGDVFAEALGGQMAIGLRNHQGPSSVRLFSRSDLVRVKAGQKYTVKLSYQTDQNGKGWYGVSIGGTEVNRTDFTPAVGNWKDTEVTVTARTDGGLTMAIGCESSGSEASVYIRSVQVRQVP